MSGPSPTAQQWADAIAARVGTYGNGHWWPPLGAWLNLPGLQWLPQASGAGRVTIQSADRAVSLVLYALPTHDRAPEHARLHHIVLDAVRFDAAQVRQHPDAAALPFALDANGETPASAGRKFTGAVMFQGRGARAATISWTLNDSRVVELQFQDGMQALVAVQVVKLWKPEQFKR